MTEMNPLITEVARSSTYSLTAVEALLFKNLLSTQNFLWRFEMDESGHELQNDS